VSAFNFDMMPENQSTKRAKQELRDALPMTESDAFGKFHVCLRCSSNALTCYGQGMNSGNVLTCQGVISSYKLLSLLGPRHVVSQQETQVWRRGGWESQTTTPPFPSASLLSLCRQDCEVVPGLQLLRPDLQLLMSSTFVSSCIAMPHTG